MVLYVCKIKYYKPQPMVMRALYKLCFNLIWLLLKNDFLKRNFIICIFVFFICSWNLWQNIIILNFKFIASVAVEILMREKGQTERDINFRNRSRNSNPKTYITRLVVNPLTTVMIIQPNIHVEPPSFFEVWKSDYQPFLQSTI